MSKTLFTDANKELVKVLVEARRNSGLKQEQLADKIGKHQSYVSNIERGQRRVDVIEFYILAKAIGVEPAELFSEAVASFEPYFAI